MPSNYASHLAERYGAIHLAKAYIVIGTRLITLQVCVAISLATSASGTHSQGKAKPIVSTPSQMSFNGVGTHSCGVYLENMKGLQFGTFRLLYQQWGSGFMAGASNEGRGANPHADLETYTAWLDKWCADDPTSDVARGVIALGKRL